MFCFAIVVKLRTKKLSFLLEINFLFSMKQRRQISHIENTLLFCIQFDLNHDPVYTGLSTKIKTNNIKHRQFIMWKKQHISDWDFFLKHTLWKEWKCKILNWFKFANFLYNLCLCFYLYIWKGPPQNHKISHQLFYLYGMTNI